jgi:hypothetical protein
MNKFYIFLGSRFGNIAWNKKKFRMEVEAFFSKEEKAVQIKQLDIRSTHGSRYHAFIDLVFDSKEKMKEFISLIRDGSTKYRVINESWKLYEYVSKKDRLNTAFCEDNDEEEEVVASNENVFEEEEEEKEEEEEVTEISFIEPVNNEDNDVEYESIYNWLITPQPYELKQAEEIKSLCKWLATPYWERT